MARLTRLDIERKLLSGVGVAWRDANNKSSQLVLDDAKKRRLFDFVLKCTVRDPTGLPQEFITGLLDAHTGTHDPAVVSATAASTAPVASSWRLQSIETEGFGGINIWGGRPFHFDFDQESLLLEGPNGSGKSSLLGAILWALTGERPRDQAKTDAHHPMPVFSTSEKPAGEWPPIACYPDDVAALKRLSRVRVTLVFKNAVGAEAKVERILDSGKVTVSPNPIFDLPSIFIESGLLMPARLSAIRLDQGRSPLTDAVQKLTGLDDLAAIGTLVEGLCHKGREYLSYKRKELSAATNEFNKAIEQARTELAVVQVPVREFKPIETNDAGGSMALFGKQLTNNAAELTQVVSSDLAAGLDLASPQIQHQVISAIGAAQSDLAIGLPFLPFWKSIETIGQSLSKDAAKKLAAAISTARSRAEEAARLCDEAKKDSKFRLKAVAAQWHSQHMAGAVNNCPLCDHDLTARQSLSHELEALKSIGRAAAREFQDNLNSISAELESSCPASLRAFGDEVLAWEPRAQLIKDIRERFIANDRYAKILTKYGALVDAAIGTTPVAESVPVAILVVKDELRNLTASLAIKERLIGLATWYADNATAWSEWWDKLAMPVVQRQPPAELEESSETAGTQKSENLSTHLRRLSEALEKADPYRKGAAAMLAAWNAGKTAAEIQKELDAREEIAECLTPLKSLNPLAESIAREAIDGLSGRIAALLSQMYLSERFQFHDARLLKKEGLVIRGAVGTNLRIDATLIANTSWLRVVLWGFLFALREEGIEQSGRDLFPLLVFDDPQSTFDSEHRHRWAQYIASLQNGPSKAQIILTSHDENFLDLIKVSGVTGRQALIAQAGADIGHVGIFEGASLERNWTEVKKLNTPTAGREYISAVRVYVEGLLRLMLRGEDAAATSVTAGYVLGQSRERINQLNDGGFTPWDRTQFKNLVSALDKNAAPIKHMEMAHHASGSALGMAEATDVESHWRKKVSGTLDHCFRLARLHHRIHGGLSALHAAPPTAVLPEGYKANVRAISLHLLGRAAALTDGRAADGCFELDEFEKAKHRKIILAQHSAYRLTAATLEPVAKHGDILLVKEPGEPSANSIVIALSDDRVLARRYERAENHSDVTVLTAQAVNPRAIAPPVIAHNATLTLHKVVGVLYGSAAWKSPLQSVTEVCECEGQDRKSVV